MKHCFSRICLLALLLASQGCSLAIGNGGKKFDRLLHPGASRERIARTLGDPVDVNHLIAPTLSPSKRDEDQGIATEIVAYEYTGRVHSP